MNSIEDIIFDVPSFGSSGPSGPPTAVLIVSFGESNSGGYALNTDAPSWEIAARPELRFWNVNTSVFEDMDIGTNNNLDHAGINSTTHGWELGLANRVRQGYFAALTPYYLQTGQGASTVAQWNVGGTYWTKFLARVAAAKAALSGTVYTTHVWVSLGYNDFLGGTTDATYKAAMQDILARIKTELPGCKIYLCELTNTTYATKMQELASEDSASVRFVSSSSPESLDLRDGAHWSYKGMKRLAARMVDATLADLSLGGKGFAWNAREDANFVTFTASNQHAHVPVAIDLTTAGYVAIEFGAWSNGFVLMLDDSTAADNWGGAVETYYGAAYSNGGTIFADSNDDGSVEVNTGVTVPCWARFRWNKALNNDLLFETSVDGGASWTLRTTWANRLNGVSSCFARTTCVFSAAYTDIWRP